MQTPQQVEYVYYARWSSFQSFLEAWTTDLSDKRMQMVLPLVNPPEGARVGIRLITPDSSSFFLAGIIDDQGSAGMVVVALQDCDSELKRLKTWILSEDVQDQASLEHGIWVPPEFGPAEDAPTEFFSEMELDLDP